MNLFIKIILASLLFIIGSYYLYFFVYPSITIINKSAHLIEKASIGLPKSNLDFGSIKPKQENTLYYSLAQDDGNYHYSFKIDGEIIIGSCGHLTNNELNKRFVITVRENNRIDCR